MKDCPMSFEELPLVLTVEEQMVLCYQASPLAYAPIAASNRNPRFAESKEVSVRDIVRFPGVPLYKLQEGKQSYQSNEQNSIEYVVSTLSSMVSQYEEEQIWKLHLPSEQQVGLETWINLMAKLQGGIKSRCTQFTIMWNISVFSPNDIQGLAVQFPYPAPKRIPGTAIAPGILFGL